MKNFFAKHKIEDEKIAVGVSGGADSLALALMMKEQGKVPIALTVNHNLRKEAQAEAEYVAKIMKENDIEHHILVWEGKIAENGIEEFARQIRYRLLIDFCKKNNINYLATAHHQRDQAETFLLRLQRGSGVFGLSGILPVSNRGGINIIRPLLNVAPDELKNFLLQKSVSWVEDPMNEDESFARVKIRHFLNKLKQIDIDEKRLAETAAVLAETRIFLQKLVDDFISNKVRLWDDVAFSLSWKDLCKLDRQIAMLVLGELVQKVGESNYMPEASELLRILEQKDLFAGCTLGKCELIMAAKRLWIVPQDEKNELMTKKQWDVFVEKFPIFKNAGLPYKVRRALWQKTDRKNG